mgnify:CR=1 FL=1
MMVQLKTQNNFLLRDNKKPEPTTIHYETSLLVTDTLRLFGDVIEISSHLIGGDRTIRRLRSDRCQTKSSAYL